MSLYALKHRKEGGYAITKLDNDYNVEGTYQLTKTECNCPAGANGRHCKHLKLIGLFEASGHIGDGYYLDDHTRMWRDPIIGDEELDGLTLGAVKPVDLGKSDEDRLVEVVAPAIATESKLTRRPAPYVSPIKCEFKMKRRKL